MELFTVWPDMQKSSDYGEIKAIDAEDAALSFADRYWCSDPFEEITLWVQQRNDDTAKTFHIKAEPSIEFYAEEV